MPEVNSIFPKNEAEEVIKVGKAIATTDDQLVKFTTDTEKLIALLNAEGASLSQLLVHYEKVKKGSQELDAVGKQLIKSEEKLKQVQDSRTKSVIENRVEVQKQTKEIKDKIKASKADQLVTEAQNGAYDKIAKSLSSNIAKWKQMTASERENSKVGKQLTATIQRQDAQLKKLDTQIGRSQRHVGNYGKALGGVAKNLLGAFGVVGGIALFAKVLTSAFSTIAKFDKAQSTLAATLGKTKEGIDELTQSAKELGVVTQFTATEVSILQNELAKLGFSSAEIKSATSGVLDLAEATGADLGEAAKVSGAALKAFGLSATEINRVVSVLAVATTKSALSFEDYGAGLSNVAPVAKAFGFTIEDTVALFGKLRDAGFDASKATTASRNIILNLADSTSKLSKELGGSVSNFEEFIPALIKLRDSGVDLNTTLQLTDKRSVAAFNQFLTGAESARQLRDSLMDVNDELSDMVDTKTDNVIGAWGRLGSAWDGFILRFSESSGGFKDFFDETATLINAWGNENISTWKKVTELVARGATRQQKEQDKLAKSLKTATKNQLELSIKNNEERLSNGSDFDKHLLQMTKDRLAEIEQTEIDSAERIKKEKEDADKKAIKSADDAADKARKKIIDRNKDLSDDQIKLARKLSYEKTEILDDDLKIVEDSNDNEVQSNIEAMDQQLAFMEAHAQAMINERQRQYEKEILLINSTASTEEEKRTKVFELNQEYIDEDIAALENRLEVEELTAAQRIEIEEQIKDIQLENAQIIADDQKSKDEQRLERQKEIADQLIGIGQSIFEFSLANTQAELDALEAKNEAGLLSDEEYNKEKARLETEQAKKKRNQALFEIAINQAVGASKTIASVGFPAAIPLLILLGVLGAIQTATVLAQEIPEYATGTKDAKREFIAGEKGRELIKLKTGKVIMAESATHFKGDEFKGASVYSNAETEKIIAQSDKRNNFVFDTQDLKKEMVSVRKAIEKKPVSIVDKSGRIIGRQSQDYREIYVNRLKNGR